MSACESTQPGSDGDQRASGFSNGICTPVLIDLPYCSIQSFQLAPEIQQMFTTSGGRYMRGVRRMKEQMIKEARPGTGPEHIRRDSGSSAGPSVC
jgi:hypothetical protein